MHERKGREGVETGPARTKSPRSDTPSLQELIARIAPESRHPEVGWAPEVGREKVEWRPATAPRVRRHS